MEKNNLVKFENVEIELVTSEEELSEVRGGKNVLSTLIDMILGGGDEPNGNCNCNCNGR